MLEALEAGEAGGLIVAKLDRLSRSVRDFCEILDRSQRQRWALVCLDLGLDTSTPTGKFTAQIIAAVAELERELIGQRTREGLESQRAKGVRLGRPPVIDPQLVERIQAMRDAGMTFAMIAVALNAEGVPTPRAGTRQAGREWWPSTIQRALRRETGLLLRGRTSQDAASVHHNRRPWPLRSGARLITLSAAAAPSRRPTKPEGAVISPSAISTARRSRISAAPHCSRFVTDSG